MFELPSKAIPFIFLAVVNLFAVLAVPDKVPVITPAVKLPLASLATIAFAVLALVAVVAVLLTFPELVIVANLLSAIAADELISASTILPVKANLLYAIAVPLQVPLVIIPTLVKLEVTTLLAKVVPLNVLASAAIVIFELPLNATPLIFLEVAKIVAVLAFPVTSPVTLPVKVPTKFVAVTVLNPASELVVAPNSIFVDPIVKALFTNLSFAIAEPLQVPPVIFPVTFKSPEIKEFPLNFVVPPTSNL